MNDQVVEGGVWWRKGVDVLSESLGVDVLDIKLILYTRLEVSKSIYSATLCKILNNSDPSERGQSGQALSFSSPLIMLRLAATESPAASQNTLPTQHIPLVLPQGSGTGQLKSSQTEKLHMSQSTILFNKLSSILLKNICLLILT